MVDETIRNITVVVILGQVIGVLIAFTRHMRNELKEHAGKGSR